MEQEIKEGDTVCESCGKGAEIYRISDDETPLIVDGTTFKTWYEIRCVESCQEPAFGTDYLDVQIVAKCTEPK